MSRLFLGSILSAALVVGFAGAAESETAGLKQGDPIGAFYVTKIGGADDDGVEKGKELCYRCKYGQRPMVMVFTRKHTDDVKELVKKLDEAVKKHDDHQLRAFVTVMGEDQAALKECAKKIADETSSEKVPVSVASDSANGPASYRIDPNSDVTVIVANESQVVTTKTFSADSIDTAAVLKEVEQMLN